MKFMKKSAKKFCLKLAASILSTTIVASIALPMNVLATTVDTTTEILSENTTINSSSPDYSDNIIREVEEERDEFSKTFLMSDGTYYTYVSPVAIHEFIEDKWVDIIRKQSGDDTIKWIRPYEHLSYQVPEKEFEISEEDFTKTMMDYLMFKQGVDVKEFEPIKVNVMGEEYTVVRKRKNLPKVSEYYVETAVTIFNRFLR